MTLRNCLKLLGCTLWLGAHWAHGAGLINPAADLAPRQVLPGNVHPKAQPDSRVSAADPALPMERIILALRGSAEQQAAMERFLRDQQDPASPDYQHWLTPAEFGVRFGPQTEDVEFVANWLQSQGFTVNALAKSGMWIEFSGTAATVQAAFQTPINTYAFDGKVHVANAQDPTIPAALARVVVGPVSLNNVQSRSMMARVQPQFTEGASSHSLAPGDFATIYNLNPLYAAGVDGKGQTIAVLGRTHPSSANWASFRSTYGLSVNPPQVVLNGPDPGNQGSDENGEADLDVEWAGAVAKEATIKLVLSANTQTSDAIMLSGAYVVNNDLAPIITVSFGQCEDDLGSLKRLFYNSLWAQAAGQGISVFVSSGDNGVADCDESDAVTAVRGRNINGMASTAFNVAVGGTMFNDSGGTYWRSTNASNGSSALGYIPEAVWNESGRVVGGSNLWGTGGGQSKFNSKPSWQVAPGVTADGTRDVPDVALNAAGNVGFRVMTEGATVVAKGTSASAPAFAGIMALVVQKTGRRQGNPNPRLYELGNAQYLGLAGAPKVFHDVTSGNNSVPGQTGFIATTGYDVVTGLGSVDATALANNWAGGVASCSYGLNGSTLKVAAGSSSFNVTVTSAVGCTWTASSSAAWLSLSSGSSGSGNGSVTVQVAASTFTSTRIGTLTIGGQTYQVTQAAINSYTSTSGNDNFVGAAGAINTAVFAGSYSQYTITVNNAGVVTVRDNTTGRDGTDTLTNIKRLQFSDQNVAFDLNGPNSAGGIYRLYAAAFNRTPDLAGVGYWVLQADLGQSASSMAAGFMFSTEFQTLYGVKMTDEYGTGLNVNSIVSGAYLNILHRTPDPGGLNYYTGQITSRSKTLGQVLAELSDSAENYTQVAAKIATGIVYTPWHN